MKDFMAILSEFGIEITDDQKKDIKKAISENYKTIVEFQKKTGELESERDSFKEKYESADSTLKTFDGIDADAMKKEIENYQSKLSETEDNYKKELYKRDFEDALLKQTEQYKFSSEFAKKAVLDEIRNAELKLHENKIYGLDEYIGTIKEKDSSAFINEETQSLEASKAKIVGSLSNQQGTKPKMTMSQLMKMKNDNPDFDPTPYIQK
jgi:hypothetical protein